MKRSTKFYTWLLRLYPARFREEYEHPMEQQFKDEYREAHTTAQRAQLWTRSLGDLLRSLPQELCREFLSDFKYSLRRYRRQPLSVGLAVLALALALGTSTGVFSVLHALLLRGLPFADPERLVELWLSPVNALSGRTAFYEWTLRNQYSENAATFSPLDVNLNSDKGGLRVKATETSANFFDVLGTQAAHGRTFIRSEDLAGQNNCAVIGYGLWRQVFAGDPNVTSRSVFVNGIRFTVVGVAPAGFDYPAKTSLWMPTVFDIETGTEARSFLRANHCATETRNDRFNSAAAIHRGIAAAQIPQRLEPKIR